MHHKTRTLLFVSFCFIGLIFSVFFFSAFDPRSPEIPPEPEIKTPVVPELYGIPLTGYQTQEQVIKRNEFFANILRDQGVDPAAIHEIVKKSKPVFDVRNMKVGNAYTLFKPRQDSGKLDYLVYEKSPVAYIVYDLRDSVRIYEGQRAVETRVEHIADTIDGSLYRVLQKNGVDPDLAVHLAEVFGSVVDFYAIKKGDWFKVAYEQEYVGETPLSAGKVLSAVFHHGGKTHRAFYYKADSLSRGDYYDENGKSLRRMFLKAPLKFSRISSRYSKRRLHPVQKVYKAHLGTDYAAPRGTPIVSTANGVVIDSRYSRYNGHYVKIKHNQTYTTQYLHMSRRAVRKGQRVNQGQVIGYVGSTGLATGPHVCYRFWKNGRQVDALKQNFKSSEPLQAHHMRAFKRQVERATNAMEAIDTSGPRTRFAMYQSRNPEVYQFFGVPD